VFVIQRMYFVYACSTNVLVNKGWYTTKTTGGPRVVTWLA